MRRGREERHTASLYGTLPSATQTDVCVESNELMRNFNLGRYMLKLASKEGLSNYNTPGMPRRYRAIYVKRE